MGYSIHLDLEQLLAEIAGRLRALPSLNAESIRAIRRFYSKQLAKAAPSEIIALADKLLDDEVPAGRFVAYELINHHAEALRCLGAKDLVRLGRGLDSWSTVDTFACYLSGPAWRERQVSDALIHDWASSTDRWWRRAALVSTVPLNTPALGGTGDSPRTLAVCRLLVDDRDDMVVKALSWALRALAKHDGESVQKFLASHVEALAARVLREVRNKLSTGRKNPRLRGDTEAERRPKTHKA
jgi:3-methyladenine DNA glycosylase AlkD